MHTQVRVEYLPLSSVRIIHTHMTCSFMIFAVPPLSSFPLIAMYKTQQLTVEGSEFTSQNHSDVVFVVKVFLVMYICSLAFLYSFAFFMISSSYQQNGEKTQTQERIFQSSAMQQTLLGFYAFLMPLSA